MPFVTSYVQTILTNLISNAYIGLSTTTPTAAGENFTEPSSSTGYKRIPLSSGNMSVSGNNVKNQDYLYFPEITSNAGTVTHLGIFSAETGGSLRYFGALTASKALNPASADEGVVPLFRPQQLSITLDDPN